MYQAADLTNQTLQNYIIPPTPASAAASYMSPAPVAPTLYPTGFNRYLYYTHMTDNLHRGRPMATLCKA